MSLLVAVIVVGSLVSSCDDAMVESRAREQQDRREAERRIAERLQEREAEEFARRQRETQLRREAEEARQREYWKRQLNLAPEYQPTNPFQMTPEFQSITGGDSGNLRQ